MINCKKIEYSKNVVKCDLCGKELCEYTYKDGDEKDDYQVVLQNPFIEVNVKSVYPNIILGRYTGHTKDVEKNNEYQLCSKKCLIEILNKIMSTLEVNSMVVSITDIDHITESTIKYWCRGTENNKKEDK